MAIPNAELRDRSVAGRFSRAERVEWPAVIRAASRSHHVAGRATGAADASGRMPLALWQRAAPDAVRTTAGSSRELSCSSFTTTATC
jgi:hypothetical protein